MTRQRAVTKQILANRGVSKVIEKPSLQVILYKVTRIALPVSEMPSRFGTPVSVTTLSSDGLVLASKLSFLQRDLIYFFKNNTH